jgi:ankyrin repeat protein
MGIRASNLALAAPFSKLADWTHADVRKMLAKFNGLELSPSLDQAGLQQLVTGAYLVFEAEIWSRDILQAFGGQRNGRILALAFISGAALCAKGKPSNTIELVFQVFDIRGERRLYFNEFLILLINVSAALNTMTGGEGVNASFVLSEQQAHVIASEVFAMFSRDETLTISAQEFKVWAREWVRSAMDAAKIASRADISLTHLLSKFLSVVEGEAKPAPLLPLSRPSGSGGMLSASSGMLRQYSSSVQQNEQDLVLSLSSPLSKSWNAPPTTHLLSCNRPIARSVGKGASDGLVNQTRRQFYALDKSGQGWLLREDAMKLAKWVLSRKRGGGALLPESTVDGDDDSTVSSTEDAVAMERLGQAMAQHEDEAIDLTEFVGSMFAGVSVEELVGQTRRRFYRLDFEGCGVLRRVQALDLGVWVCHQYSLLCCTGAAKAVTGASLVENSVGASDAVSESVSAVLEAAMCKYAQPSIELNEFLEVVFSQLLQVPLTLDATGILLESPSSGNSSREVSQNFQSGSAQQNSVEEDLEQEQPIVVNNYIDAASVKVAEEQAAKKEAEEQEREEEEEEEEQAAKMEAEEQAAREEEEEQAAKKKAEEQAATKEAEEQAARKEAEEQALRPPVLQKGASSSRGFSSTASGSKRILAIGISDDTADSAVASLGSPVTQTAKQRNEEVQRMEELLGLTVKDGAVFHLPSEKGVEKEREKKDNNDEEVEEEAEEEEEDGGVVFEMEESSLADESVAPAIVQEMVQKEVGEQQRKEAEEQERRQQQARQEVEEAKQEAGVQARKEAEEHARKEAEDTQVGQEAEKAQAERQEVEEQARKKEAEEQARREVEEQARKEAEEQARKEAEEQARKEAEEQARKEAEEQARKEAEEQARKEAEEQGNRKAEEQARREAEEQGRKEAAEQGKRDAEEQARRLGFHNKHLFLSKEAEEQAARKEAAIVMQCGIRSNQARAATLDKHKAKLQQQYKDTFSRMDVSHTGYITREEHRLLYKKAGADVEDAQVQQGMRMQFDSVDLDRDGRISCDDFVQAQVVQNFPLVQHKASEQFEARQAMSNSSRLSRGRVSRSATPDLVPALSTTDLIAVEDTTPPSPSTMKELRQQTSKLNLRSADSVKQMAESESTADGVRAADQAGLDWERRLREECADPLASEACWIPQAAGMVYDGMTDRFVKTQLALDTQLLQAAWRGDTQEMASALTPAVQTSAPDKGTVGGGRNGSIGTTPGVEVDPLDKLASKQVARVDAIDFEGNTALMRACTGGFVECVDQLLDCRSVHYSAAASGVPTLMLQNRQGDTALMGACWGGHAAVVEKLIRFCGANEAGSVYTMIDQQNDASETALVKAAWRGHVACVQLILQAYSIDRNPTDSIARIESRNTALIGASMEGHHGVVRVLLEGATKGGGARGARGAASGVCANVNTTNREGETPLLLACTNGHVKTVELLLAAGADPWYGDTTGLGAPVDSSDTGTVRAGAGADAGSAMVQAVCNRSGESALTILGLLLRSTNGSGGDSSRAKRDEGCVDVLMWAAWNARVDCLRLLLQHSVDIRQRNSAGETALMRASWKGHREVLQLLLDAQPSQDGQLAAQGAQSTAAHTAAYVNGTNADGDTALLCACWNGHDRCVQLLLQHGADATAANGAGDTPLQGAMEGKHEVCAQLIRQSHITAPLVDV